MKNQMWSCYYEKSLISLVKGFIPPAGKLLLLKSPYGKFDIKLIDIDFDGALEIIVHYKLKNEKYTLILKNYYGVWYKIGNYKIKNRVSTGYENKQNLYPVNIKTKKGRKWGYINDTGKFIINPKYDYAHDFQRNGLAIIEMDNLSGIIDIYGNYVIPPKYETITKFSEGRASVVKNNIFKVIDENGSILTKDNYEFIGMFENGRALFTKNNPNTLKTLYGYLDKNGKEIIKAQYKNGSNFKNGKALVKFKDNHFGIINLKGEVLNSYNYYNVINLSDGLLSFQKNENGKYGYISEKGNVVIKPKYTTALPFKSERAIVNISENYSGNKYGIIDKTGAYIIPPKYNIILNLGENRFALGIPINPNEPYLGSKFAVVDNNGNLLTDFKYYDISNYNKGYASVYDNKNTFFIDKNGDVAKNLPTINGKGTLSFVGNLIKASVDNKLYYYDKTGNIIWKQQPYIKLNNTYKISEKKFKPNNNYLVYIPKIYGMENEIMEKAVNKKLYDLSQIDPVIPYKKADYTYSGDFDVKFFKKNLLVLSLYGYQFYYGAAHGMPSQIYPHINLVTGKFYELKDLFKKDVNYVNLLSKIIKYKIENDPKYRYVYDDVFKKISKNQLFYVDENNLYIVFTPYEIAPYSEGFVTFKIPFNMIMPIIDTKGDFWQSFN